MTVYLRILLTAASLLVMICGASATARPIDIDDLGAMVRIASPRISPDGRSIVIVVSRPDYEENRFENRLVLVDIDSGTQMRLTNTRPAVNSPRWSPSGDRIAFLAMQESDGEKRPQVFVLPTGGGEARPITEAPLGVGAFEWMPDGDSIVYAAADKPPDEPEGPERHN
jgi:dipeptidyl aminopeptidase/acylaminoacyl peptidase